MPRRLWILLPLLVLATLFFYPLALIVKQAFTDDRLFSAAALQQVFESRRFVGALLNTLQIALLATLGCRCSAPCCRCCWCLRRSSAAG